MFCRTLGNQIRRRFASSISLSAAMKTMQVSFRKLETHTFNTLNPQFQYIFHPQQNSKLEPNYALITIVSVTAWCTLAIAENTLMNMKILKNNYDGEAVHGPYSKEKCIQRDKTQQQIRIKSQQNELLVLSNWLFP